MGHLSAMFSGLARSLSLRKGKNSSGCKCNIAREAAEEMAKEAKKNDLILRTSGTVSVDGSNNFASVFSKRGDKGINQDCCIVWEVRLLSTKNDLNYSLNLNHSLNLLTKSH